MAVVPYRAADGHSAHGTHACREVRHQYRRAVARIALKALRNDRVFLYLLLDGKHTLHDARDPDGVVIGLNIVVLALVHAADYAALDKLVHHGLGVLNARAGLFGYDLDAPALAHFYVHADVRHLVRHDRVEYHVLGVGRSDAGIGAGLKAYLRRKEKYLFSEGHLYPSFHIKNSVFQHYKSFYHYNFLMPPLQVAPLQICKSKNCQLSQLVLD